MGPRFGLHCTALLSETLVFITVEECKVRGARCVVNHAPCWELRRGIVRAHDRALKRQGLISVAIIQTSLLPHHEPLRSSTLSSLNCLLTLISDTLYLNLKVYSYNVPGNPLLH